MSVELKLTIIIRINHATKWITWPTYLTHHTKYNIHHGDITCLLTGAHKIVRRHLINTIRNLPRAVREIRTLILIALVLVHFIAGRNKWNSLPCMLTSFQIFQTFSLSYYVIEIRFSTRILQTLLTESPWWAWRWSKEERGQGIMVNYHRIRWIALSVLLLENLEGPAMLIII